jgi:uncharacterized membrane protein (UPF0127 family)
LVIGLALGLLTGRGHGDASDAGFRAFGAALVRLLPGGRPSCVLVAGDAAARQRGLMQVSRDALRRAGYRGMLFEFEDDGTGTFWMRNTPTPLSIAFFDGDGRFVSSTDMAPCGDRDDCPTYAATGAYRRALEVPRGELGSLGVAPGSRLVVGAARGSCHTPRADS